MKGKALFLLAFIVGLVGVIYFFSVLYTASWWVYAIIYFLLFYLWAKPLLVLYHSLLAGHMLKKRAYTRVAEEYDKIADLKKVEGYSNYAKGLAYYYRKEYKQAEEQFHTALERGIRTQRKANEFLTQVALATVNMEQKRWQAAGKIFQEIEQTLEKGGQRPSSKLLSVYYPLYGEWLFKQKQFDKARQCFDLAYVRHPELVGEEAYYYAKLLLQNSEHEKACKLLNHLLHPNNQWKIFRLSVEEVRQLYNEQCLEKTS